MEILIHIGPHKTATTSLQQALLTQYGSKAPGIIWYPPPEKHGPGHAELAWNFYHQTTHQHNGSTGSFRDIAALATHSGCQKLIISAEELSHLDDHSIGQIRNELNGHEIHLLVTLTPFRRRVTSTWQEMVKHGYDEPLETFIRQIPTLHAMQGDLVNRWVKILHPNKTMVVNISPESPPEQIFKDISECTGLELEPKTSKLNPGMGGIETSILRLLNANKITRNNLKARTLAMRILNSKPWRLLVPKTPITLPQGSEPAILQFCANNSKCLEELHKQDTDVQINDRCKAA